MTGFVLNYGTEDGSHVEMDIAADRVRYWPAGDVYPIALSVDGFAKQYPELIEEMVKNGAIKNKL